jgi:hypothetical protein
MGDVQPASASRHGRSRDRLARRGPPVGANNTDSSYRAPKFPWTQATPQYVARSPLLIERAANSWKRRRVPYTTVLLEYLSRRRQNRNPGAGSPRRVAPAGVKASAVKATCCTTA